MRRLLVLSVAALAACGGIAGATPTDRGAAIPAGTVSRDLGVGEFDKVVSVGPHLAQVTVGPARSVRVEGAPQTLDKLEAVIVRGELQLRPKRQYRENYTWPRGERATFYVTVPRLEGATVAGSGDMTVDRIAGGSFAGTVAGSGNLDIGALEVDDATLTVAGSGNLTARGSARQAQVTVAGSGSVQAKGLASRRLPSRSPAPAMPS